MCRYFNVLVLSIVVNAAGFAAEDPAQRAASPWERPALDSMNRELPKWLKFSGEFRTRWENRTAFGYRQGNDDGYLLSRVRLTADIRPASWMQLVIQAQDAHVGGVDRSRAAGFKDIFDLRQAYVYFGRGEKGRIAVRAGRQDLLFGAQRLVGPLDWSNFGRSFDAVRLELTSPNARADLFAASVVNVDPSHFNKRRDGQNFHGVYSQFKKAIPKSVLEPFVFWKTAPRISRFTGGVRLASQTALRGFDYQVDAARQWGHSGTGAAETNIEAWAAAAVAGYTLGKYRWAPRFSTEYAYATGDADPRDGRTGTFDNLYPTNHLYYGLSDLVGWQNLKYARIGFDAKPHRKVKANFDYHWFWLADRHDHLYGAALGIAVRAPTGGALHTDVGREVNVALTCTVTTQLTFGAGVGHLFPGRFLRENSPGSPTTFGYLFGTLKF
jgi:hypothetical protein